MVYTIWMNSCSLTIEASEEMKCFLSEKGKLITKSYLFQQGWKDEYAVNILYTLYKPFTTKASGKHDLCKSH